MHSQKNKPYSGKLVAFEGIDRAGKTSVISMLVNLLTDCKVPIEAYGELQSPVAPILRDILRSKGSPALKTFLFAADRAWVYEEKCLPALQSGKLVLWDRYVDSAIVYRTVEFANMPSYIDMNFVRLINEPFVVPDLSIYIDVTVQVSEERAKLAGTKEPYSTEFLEQVRREYQTLALERNYQIIDGMQPVERVVSAVVNVIRENLQELFQDVNC